MLLLMLMLMALMLMTLMLVCRLKDLHGSRYRSVVRID